MPPAVVAGEELLELGEQVVVASRTGLQDGDAGGRVRDEDLQQPVGLLLHEVRALVGQVHHHGDAAGTDGTQLRSHGGDLSRSSRRASGGPDVSPSGTRWSSM